MIIYCNKCHDTLHDVIGRHKRGDLIFSCGTIYKWRCNCDNWHKYEPHKYNVRRNPDSIR